MRRITVLVACVLAAAALLALAMPAIAGAAYATNAECLACHDQVTGSGAVSKADFSAGGSVDYTKCRACHWIPQATLTHGNFSHNHIIGKVFPSGYKLGGPNCTPCHYANATGTGDLTHVMTTQTVDGWFATANPRLVPAADLHAIHARGSWPKNVLYTKGCASCHEAAACTACHVNPPVAHTDHTKNAISGTYAYPPVAYKIGIGTPVTSPDLATVTTSTVTCVNAACHALAAAGTSAFDKPACGSCHDDKLSEHGYGSTPHVSNLGAATEPGGTTTCAECHSMDLMTEHGKPTSAGARSCATCHPSPRDTFTTWDQGCEQCHVPASPTAKHSGVLAAHALAGDATCVACHDTPLAAIHSIATTTAVDGTFTSCLVCHNPASAATLPGKTCVDCHFAFDAHYDATAHGATLGADCAKCHVAGMSAEHSKSSVSPSVDCVKCHEDKVDGFTTAWDKSCEACHSSTHGEKASKHTVSAASTTSCGGADCHDTTDVTAIHTSAVSGALTGCYVCHSDPTKVPASVECDSCHAGHGDLDEKHTVYASATCLSCHEKTDARALHAGNTTFGKCAVCHKNTARVPVLPTDVECASCHADLTDYATAHYDATAHGATLGADCAKCHVAGMSAEHSKSSVSPSVDCVKCHEDKVDGFTTAWDKSCEACHSSTHGEKASKHTVSAASTTSCGGADCHDTTDVTAIHTSAVSGALTGCYVCHSDPTKVPASVECDSCHAGHGDLDEKHTVYASATCLSCHEKTDARALHAGNTTFGKCAVCHKNTARVPVLPTDVECASCHADLTDYATAHYDATAHGATLGADCAKCHVAGMSAEHSKSSVSPSVDCVKCHEDKVDGFTTAWDKSCEACHSSTHGEKASKHTVSAASTTSCGGADCHDTTDVTAIHTSAVSGALTGCYVCHSDPTKVPASVECDSCHAGHGDLDEKHTVYASATCLSCHEKTDARALHAGNTTFGKCAVCHKNTARVPVLPTDVECASCHADLTDYATAHYDATAHGATLGADCAKCHVAGMSAEHSKNSVSPSVDCVKCHEDKVDGFTTAWDKSCEACHSSTHGEKASKHTVSAASTTSCGGADCHDTTDVTAIHTSAVSGALTGCYVCHSDPTKVPASVECDSCHAGHGDLDEKHTVYASATCLSCHEKTDARALHAGNTTFGKCAVCHKNTARVPVLPTDVECASCHADLTDYATAHYDATAHGATLGADCAKCHVAGMSAEHSKSSVSPSVDCVKCHEDKVDGFTTAWDKSCEACHASTHTAKGSKHTATASAACGGVGCHATGDVAAIHSLATTTVAGVIYNGCYVCHNTPTKVPVSAECASCHPTGHDPAVVTTAHTAKTSSACVVCHESADVRTVHAGSLKGACAVCHDRAVGTLPTNAECATCHGAHVPVDPAHYSETTHTASAQTGTGCTACHSMSMKAEHFKTTISPAVTCVSCHEGRVDGFGASWVWNKTCDVCHSTATRHSLAATKHIAGNVTCAGVGCHDVTKVDVLHDPSVSKCAACHKPGAVLTTDCAAAGCHADLGASHHALHDASGVIDAGCKGCHSTFLDTEHALLGKTCATCHDSTNAAVVAAIENHQRACSACHPAVLNGQNTHAKLNTEQFIRGNQSSHRAYASLPAQRTSFFINGVTRTWTLPADSAYLKTGWTSTSVVTCDQCHTFSSSAAGPHGATVGVNLDPAYPTDWKTVYLGSSGSHTSSTSGASSDTFICAKCHANFGSMNGTHSDSNHRSSRDGRCIGCHTKIPHGWRLPRLLAYTNDPVPYASLNLTGLAVKDYTTNRWSRDDCTVSGCSEHSGSMSNRWPSTVLAVGTITGTVTDAANAAVTGATVTNDRAQSATTDAGGTYTFTSVPAGTTAVNVTVAKTGYITQSKPITFTDGQTVTLDFKLAKLGSIAGVVTDAATGLPLAGVTVSFTGASASTDANGAYSFTGLTAGTRTLTFAKSGYVSQTKSVTVANDTVATMNVALAPLPNLALNKTWLASRYQGSPSTTYAPAKAGDAILTTYWWSSSTGGSTTVDWLTVDLGSSQSISKVDVLWFDGYWAKNFRILTSTSSSMPSVGSSSWTSVYSTTSGVGGTSAITFSSRSARWVRVECQRTSGVSTGYGVAEMRVFQ